jgi:hypothetical protein
MAITFKTTGAWGAGKGAPLTEAEIDANFYWLKGVAESLADRPAPAVNVQEVVRIGDTFKVVMSDSTEYGPYDIPIIQYAWRGTWAPGVDYEQFDLIHVEDAGIFYVLVDHHSESTFDQSAADTDGLWYKQMTGVATGYDLSFFVPGVVGAWYQGASPIFQYVAPRPIYIPAGTGSDVGQVAVAVADSANSTTLSIRLNGTEVGEAIIAASAIAGAMTFDYNVVISPGDLLSIEQPATVSTAEDLSIVIVAKRGHP